MGQGSTTEDGGRQYYLAIDQRAPYWLHVLVRTPLRRAISSVRGSARRPTRSVPIVPAAVKRPVDGV
jgi:hypothetical protein